MQMDPTAQHTDEPRQQACALQHLQPAFPMEVRGSTISPRTCAMRQPGRRHDLPQAAKSCQLLAFWLSRLRLCRSAQA